MTEVTTSTAVITILLSVASLLASTAAAILANRNHDKLASLTSIIVPQPPVTKPVTVTPDIVINGVIYQVKV